MTTYGYARVSTDVQSLDAQVKQLRAAGAEKVFLETANGVRADCAQLRRALDQLAKGDVLMVMHHDRLVRSTVTGASAPRLAILVLFSGGGWCAVWRGGGLRPDRLRNACGARRRRVQSYRRRLPLSYPVRRREHRA